MLGLVEFVKAIVGIAYNLKVLYGGIALANIVSDWQDKVPKAWEAVSYEKCSGFVLFCNINARLMTENFKRDNF